MNKIVLYSSHCPHCVEIEAMFKQKGVEYEVVDDPDVYMPIAREHQIISMPFADVDGEIYDYQELCSMRLVKE